MLYKKIIIISFVFGIILLSLNIYGLFISLRSPLIYNPELFSHKTSDIITMSETEVFSKISQRKGHTNEEFLEITTDSIHNGMLHYWDDELKNEFNLRIPIYENYILFTLSYIHPGIFQKYEISGLWEKGVERGVGWCSQSSCILASALRSNGLKSKVYVMQNHTVALIEVDAKEKKEWIADPDYGVVIRHSIDEVESNPKLIKLFYEEKGYDQNTINNLVAIFDKNNEIERKSNFIRHTNYCSLKHRVFEYFTYVIKWILPFILIFPLVYAKSIKRRQH
jgi:hypothetical protein